MDHSLNASERVFRFGGRLLAVMTNVRDDESTKTYWSVFATPARPELQFAAVGRHPIV
jgi:hypothetical protein